VDDICFDIGGGAPLHGFKVKDSTSDIHVVVTSGVIPTYGDVHKFFLRFKNQSSTPSTTLRIKSGIPFMVIDDIGREIVKDMKLSLYMK
jgi:hypothetical protein